MSNISAIGSAALQLAAEPHGRSTTCAEEVPWCGTTVPGFHPPRPHFDSLLQEVALNPQPLPPQESHGLAGSVRSSLEEDPCGNGRHVLPLPPPGPWPWHADLGALMNGGERR